MIVTIDVVLDTCSTGNALNVRECLERQAQRPLKSDTAARCRFATSHQQQHAIIREARGPSAQ